MDRQITRDMVMALTNYKELFDFCETDEECDWVDARRFDTNETKNGQPRTLRFETVRNEYFKKFHGFNVRRYDVEKVDKYAGLAEKRKAELAAKRKAEAEK